MHIKPKHLIERLYEAIAWLLYGLSRLRLAPKPLWTFCIAEFVTCGYRMDSHGFPKFPLYSLARKIEDNCKKHKETNGKNIT
jgi:hypothetical protein